MSTDARPLWRRTRAILAIEIAALVVLVVLVVLGVSGSRTPAGPPVLSVGSVWARATPPGAATASVYLEITNDGGTGDVIVGADTPAAGSVMVHQTEVTDNIATMTELGNGIAIPAGGSVSLSPGGNHLMLSSLPGPLVEGTTFPISLRFGSGATISTTVTVLGAAATGP
ncbi:MAG: copper chaperone PCu(A)C [Bauldia sp.]|nr:copper chaperone PCu(A)C [Bauldia sp.]